MIDLAAFPRVPLLLDSDVLIDYLGDKPVVTAIVNKAIPCGVAVSVISYLEALHGLRNAYPPTEAEERLAAVLIDIPTLPVTLAIAARCVDVRLAVLAGGRSIRPRALDLLIAATAIHHDLLLLTRNRSDYAGIPNLRFAAPFCAFLIALRRSSRTDRVHVRQCVAPWPRSAPPPMVSSAHVGGRHHAEQPSHRTNHA